MRAIAGFVLSAALLVCVPATASATWSVIALDAKTGQVIIASATCVRQAGFPQRTPNGSRDLMDVQAVIVPGLGVAACQAGVDNTRRNQMLVYNEIKKGTPPAQIIELLKKDPDVERRQFGIVMMPQGDAITPRNNRTMADRVMAAMEAADQYGGDHRCNCGNNPLAHVPCDGKTAHVAYIAIADKEDAPGVTHNDGKYFAYLSVSDDDTKAGESGNPVKTLRLRYDAWKKAGAGRTAPPGPTPFKPAP
jgi:hypothetical protein